MYLFHNIYGDAAELIVSAPDGVECVPWGPTAEAEAARNVKLAELNASISALPALLYWRDEVTIEDVTIPAHWREIRICDLPQPWTWEQILSLT